MSYFLSANNRDDERVSGLEKVAVVVIIIAVVAAVVVVAVVVVVSVR